MNNDEDDGDNVDDDVDGPLAREEERHYLLFNKLNTFREY